MIQLQVKLQSSSQLLQNESFSPRLKGLVLKEVSDKSKLDEDFLPVNRNPLSPKFYTRLFLEIKKFQKEPGYIDWDLRNIKGHIFTTHSVSSSMVFLYFLQTSPCHLSTGNLEIKVSPTFNCRFNTFRLDEHHFETRGDRHFNCAGTIAKVDHTMQNFSTHGSPNSVSILLCNG